MSAMLGKRHNHLISIVALAACVSCATTQSSVDLKLDTKQLDGWLSARGEWILFPRSDFENYELYVGEKLVPEEDRCISLVNSTSSTRDEIRKFDGSRVNVVGYAVRYDELPLGNSVADQLLSKRYLGNEMVANSCLRPLVFVVTGIEIKY